MTYPKSMAVLAMVAVGFVGDSTGAAKKPTKVEMSGMAKISLCQAVDTALKAVPGGIAYQVELELEKDKPVFEVLVLKDGKVTEIEINVADGSIVEAQVRE